MSSCLSWVIHYKKKTKTFYGIFFPPTNHATEEEKTKRTILKPYHPNPVRTQEYLHYFWVVIGGDWALWRQEKKKVHSEGWQVWRRSKATTKTTPVIIRPYTFPVSSLFSKINRHPKKCYSEPLVLFRIRILLSLRDKVVLHKYLPTTK